MNTLEINAGLLTPVMKIDGLYFKREDLFAPLGRGGINGSKLRQLIWLIKTAKENGCEGILAGAVSASPQHAMVAAVSKCYDLPCVLTVGTKDIDKYPMLKLAAEHGAQFAFSKVGYAQVLQAKAFELQKKEEYKDYFVVETNITVSENLNSPERIKAFHEVGAAQVENIPDEIDTIILPCGSCNSAVSVLYGIYLHMKVNVKNIVLMGIGSIGSKNIGYVLERLRSFCPEAADYYAEVGDIWSDKITLSYFNLNGEGYCKYEDVMPFNYGGIDFHPRYEGKMMNYIAEKGLLRHFLSRKTLFWIVGSLPKE